MDIEVVKAKVRANEFLLSDHADHEAADESIDIAEIRQAIWDGEFWKSTPIPVAAKVVSSLALPMSARYTWSAVGAARWLW